MKQQTISPTEMIVLYSDEDVSSLKKIHQDVLFFEDENMNDWGHQKRSKGLERATSDFVFFVNDDDSYDKDFIRIMLEAVKENDVAHCDWNWHMTGRFAPMCSTSGNFIIKTSLAKSIGWKHRIYEADAKFIEEVCSKTDKIVHIPMLLYRHNEQN